MRWGGEGRDKAVFDGIDGWWVVVSVVVWCWGCVVRCWVVPCRGMLDSFRWCGVARDVAWRGAGGVGSGDVRRCGLGMACCCAGTRLVT